MSGFHPGDIVENRYSTGSREVLKERIGTHCGWTDEKTRVDDELWLTEAGHQVAAGYFWHKIAG